MKFKNFKIFNLISQDLSIQSAHKYIEGIKQSKLRRMILEIIGTI